MLAGWLAVCLVVVACLFAFTLVLRTLAGVCRLKVFIPEHKWGPMSHLPLAQVRPAYWAGLGRSFALGRGQGGVSRAHTHTYGGEEPKVSSFM